MLVRALTFWWHGIVRPAPMNLWYTQLKQATRTNKQQKQTNNGEEVLILLQRRNNPPTRSLPPGPLSRYLPKPIAPSPLLLRSSIRHNRRSNLPYPTPPFCVRTATAGAAEREETV